MLNIYVTSSQRKSGKTFISAGLSATLQSLGYNTGFYKPIQMSGIEKNGFAQSPDLTFVKSIDPYINTHFTYLFKADTEPLLAAEDENEFIDIDLISHEYMKFSNISDCTIVDGEAGIMSPVAPNILSIDIVKKLQIPLLIVTTPNKDTISSTLNIINTAVEKEINIRGIIINNVEENCPKYMLTGISRVIEEYSNAKILGLVPHVQDIYAPEDIIASCLNGIDIESIFNVKMEKLDCR